MFMGKPEGKRPIESPRRKWQDNINMNLREMGWDGMEFIFWLRIRTSGGWLLSTW
jgi:hypothetical protein